MKGPGRHLRVFEVVDGKALANGRMFCTVAEEDGVPDGVRCDTQGNVWVGIASGVDVYAPDGTKLARIKAPYEMQLLCICARVRVCVET